MKRSAVPLVLLLAACGGKPVPTAQPAPPPEPPAEVHVTPSAPPSTTPTQTAQPQVLAFPDDAFRSKQPPPTAPRPVNLPKVKPFSLKSGIKVYLVEQHTLPLVSMELVFDGGAATDPHGKEGLATTCMAMLVEGTEKLDKLQYSEALADTASSIGAFASDDSVSVSLSSLTKHLDDTFSLFVDTIRTPGFRASDFERLVKRRIESVKQAKGTPAAVNARVTGAVLYGASHPLGAVTTEASLTAVTLDDCKAFATAALKPSGARLFVVGDLTEGQVRGMFEGKASTQARPALVSWKGAAKAKAIPAPQTMKGRVFFVNVPGAAQSVVSYLQFGPKRTAPDFFQNSLMASVFGGGFASRLNMNLREDKGYSYGARGGFGYSKQFGTFTATSSVRTDATYQTLVEIDREVKQLWQGKAPVTKDELDREKQGSILGLPGQFATAAAALGNYRRLVYFGLPLNYFSHYVANVQKVSESQVKASAAKHLKPGQAVYLVVGDGNAPMIVHVPDAKPGEPKDQPYLKDGKPLTLRQALTDLATRGDVGAGALVELDTDGNPLP